MSAASIRQRLAAAPRLSDMSDEAFVALMGHAPTDLALLLAAVDAAEVVAERLACNHVFDPECARCEWLSPLRRALERVEAGE